MSMMRKYSRSILGAFLLTAFAILVPSDAVSQKSQPPNCLGGTLSAPVRMEVFSDFECSACQLFYMETIKKLLQNYTPADKVCIIYHEFPLERHSMGHQAARFSLAAQRIGRKQWLAVVDALYTKQSQWTRDGKIDVALIGSVSTEDLIRIKSIAREPYIEQALERDIALGNGKEVNSTPTIFWTALNRAPEKIDQAVLPYDVWKKNIDRIIK
jgi:protein-disulfide isomerase